MSVEHRPIRYVADSQPLRLSVDSCSLLCRQLTEGLPTNHRNLVDVDLVSYYRGCPPTKQRTPRSIVGRYIGRYMLSDDFSPTYHYLS